MLHSEHPLWGTLVLLINYRISLRWYYPVQVQWVLSQPFGTPDIVLISLLIIQELVIKFKSIRIMQKKLGRL